LNDLVTVKAAAASFATQETKLDILWNNAGAFCDKPDDRTAQDLEPTIGQNCVGTLLFTNLLVPQLRAASTSDSPARVIWSSSYLAEGAAVANGVDFSLLDKGTGDQTKTYAVSKAGTWSMPFPFYLSIMSLIFEILLSYSKDNSPPVLPKIAKLKSLNSAGPRVCQAIWK
jgi:NAD(P)-dependent dehydrogenase (short-subunit alcohol dehydrogenase family)